MHLILFNTDEATTTSQITVEGTTACPRKSRPQQMECPQTNSVLKKIVTSIYFKSHKFQLPPDENVRSFGKIVL